MGLTVTLLLLFATAGTLIWPIRTLTITGIVFLVLVAMTTIF